MSDEKRAGVRVTCRGGSDGIFELRGLTPEEIELMQAVLSGCQWVSGDKDGRLCFSSCHKPLPEPVDDKEMLAHWPITEKSEGKEAVQLELWTSGELGYLSHPSIIIQHLCGYGYSPSNYEWQARKLESFGFECLRSRRDKDGKFSEVWLLASLVFAKGGLEEYLDACPEDELKINRAKSFLAHNVSFGTLDICVQKLAASID